MPDDTALVEALSAQLHAIYQREAHRQGDVRHPTAYADLREATKEYDRVLARFLLKHVPPGIVISRMLADPLTD
jgi:hypothetical protein